MTLHDYTVYFFNRHDERLTTEFYHDTTLREVWEEMQAACWRRRAHYAKIYRGGVFEPKGRCIRIYRRYY